MKPIAAPIAKFNVVDDGESVAIVPRNNAINNENAIPNTISITNETFRCFILPSIVSPF
jgi:hypothetical protein